MRAQTWGGRTLGHVCVKGYQPQILPCIPRKHPLLSLSSRLPPIQSMRNLSPLEVSARRQLNETPVAAANPRGAAAEVTTSSNAARRLRQNTEWSNKPAHLPVLHPAIGRVPSMQRLATEITMLS